MLAIARRKQRDSNSYNRIQRQLDEKSLRKGGGLPKLTIGLSDASVQLGLQTKEFS